MNTPAPANAQSAPDDKANDVTRHLTRPEAYICYVGVLNLTKVTLKPAQNRQRCRLLLPTLIINHSHDWRWRREIGKIAFSRFAGRRF